MGELGALFNPGMRHELEERRARAARREEEGNARDGDLRIDLDSGVAVINAPDDESDDGATRDRATDDGATGDAPSAAAPPDGQGDRSTESDGRPDESPAGGIRATDDAATVTAENAVTPENAETPANAESAAGLPAKPAPLRPRGKRAMASGR